MSALYRRFDSNIDVKDQEGCLESTMQEIYISQIHPKISKISLVPVNFKHSAEAGWPLIVTRLGLALLLR